MYLNRPRPRRPYEKKKLSKGGAIIFGFGAGGLIATMCVIMILLWPYVSTRVENLPNYARTYYRKLVPHPEYLPTPVPTSSISVAAAAGNDPVPSPSSTPTPTKAPADEAVPVPTRVAAETLPLPALSDIQLQGFSHQWQTWNNCGPATITTNLSYFGRPETQADAALLLKPN